jgi:hypothetical protein
MDATHVPEPGPDVTPETTAPLLREAPIASHSQSRLWKKVLKQQIRVRGFRYQDIANDLDVSVMTVKRHLNSDRVPIECLEEIAACIGLSLIEIAELAKAASRDNVVDLETQQEEALAKDHALAAVRTMLYAGMSVPEIMTRFDLDEATLNGILACLDRLKLIELYPGNRVRIRGSRVIEWRAGGPMRREIDGDIRHNFMQMDFTNTEDYFGYETACLTPSSICQIEDQMRQLVRSMRLLHQIDSTESTDQKEWITLLVAKQPNDWFFTTVKDSLRAKKQTKVSDRSPK